MITAQELLDLHFMASYEKKFLIEQILHKNVTSEPVLFVGINNSNLIFISPEERICLNIDKYKHITNILADKLNNLPICKQYNLLTTFVEIEDFDNISRRYLFVLKNEQVCIRLTLAPEEAIHLDRPIVLSEVTNEIEFYLEKAI